MIIWTPQGNVFHIVPWQLCNVEYIALCYWQSFNMPTKHDKNSDNIHMKNLENTRLNEIIVRQCRFSFSCSLM